MAMSGGVDSSVAAYILQQAGHNVAGLHMHLWCEEKQGQGAQRRQCCNAEDAHDAELVCQRLGIPFYVVNFRDEFQAQVVDYFCREYAQGRTPNPCIACNAKIKFRLLLERALSLGGEYLATGHYARTGNTDGKQSSCRLLEGTDKAKDQSYFLYMLGQEELGHLLFPVGGMTKSEVRQLAAEQGLRVARKADSVEVCFVADGGYRGFLASRIRQSEGDILDLDGATVGRHKGLAGYTIGQRARLDRGNGKRLYVVALDKASNRVIVGPEEASYSQGLIASSVRWVSGQAPQGEIECKVRVRYRSPGAKAVLTVRGGAAGAFFQEPQRAVAPGQAAVFYDGEEVLGGGIIERALTSRHEAGPNEVAE